MSVLIGCAGSPVADVRDLLEAGEAGVTSVVVDGDTLELESGTVVRLVGLQAPKLPLGRKGFVPWPLGEQSKMALSAMTMGKRLTLAYGGRKKDRYQRALAHLFEEGGLWVQGEMLRQGMARVYSFPDNRTVVREMLKIEKTARLARRGIWADPFYYIRTPDTVGRDIDTFQIVEGRVYDAAKVKGTIYLNFGANWRTDFTMMAKVTARRLFDRVGVDLLSLKGKLVRGRGWVRYKNGPMIVLTHPEQLEILAP